MASGLGPNLILGPGRDIVTGLLGYQPNWEHGGGGFNLFGQDPMAGARDAMDWGRQGLYVSRGPQDTQWSPGQQWNQINTPAGINTALFGASYNPSFQSSINGAPGQGAYERFMDSGDSYLRRFGTDLRDEQGNLIGFSPERGAGARSISTFGGRNSFNDPLTGTDYGTHREFAGLAALQQGASPFLNDPSAGSALVRQNEQSSPFARADPSTYLNWSRYSDSLNPTTADVANSYVRPTYELGGESVGEMSKLNNAYENILLQQMAREGSKDLSLGLQDAQGTMAAMGLGRSGAGQSTAAGVWRDIQEQNALQRNQLLAQFREAGMQRQADAIMGQQQGGINAAIGAQQLGGMGSESRLQRGNAAAMGGLDALTGSLEASRGAERAAMGQGMDRTLQWNLGTQGNYLNSLQGADQASLNRMIAESQEQSRGMSDYARLQAIKDQMRSDRLNEMLGLEDRYRTSQNEVLNQMQQYGMLPFNSIMQLITGIQTGGVGGSRTSPWGPMLAQGGMDYLGGLLGNMGQVPQTSNINDTEFFG